MDSRFKHVEAFIQLERGVYEEGSQVNGMIIIQSNQPVRASQLRILFKGEEKVQYTKMESNPRYVQMTEEERTRNPDIPHQLPKHFNNQQPFYNSHHPIATFPDGMIQPGVYQYPFGFKLAQGIPNTFEHYWKSEGFQSEALISYSLTAQLIADNNDRPLSETIKYITINNTSNGRMEETKKVTKDHIVYNYCCKDHGSIVLATYFEKDWYFTDDDAFIVCEIDNSRSQMKINKVTCQLDQDLICKGSKHDSVNKSSAIQGQNQELNLLPGKKMTGTNAVRLKLQLARTEGANINSTVSSELVKCSHRINVTLLLEGCCHTIPVNTQNVTLFNRMHLQQIANSPTGIPTHVYNPVVFSPQMNYMQPSVQSHNIEYPTM